MKANKILTIIICTVLAAILVSCGLFVFSVKEVIGEFSLFDPTNADRLQNILDEHKGDNLKGKEIYLLRNESRKGIGFFEASNFYPDFILWVNDGTTQHVTFIDPKGIRNLRGLNDPKIQLFKQLRDEVQPTLNDPPIILDSYIVSNTDYRDVSFWGTSPEFTDSHVVFQGDENYLDIMFEQILK